VHLVLRARTEAPPRRGSRGGVLARAGARAGPAQRPPRPRPHTASQRTTTHTHTRLRAQLYGHLQPASQPTAARAAPVPSLRAGSRGPSP
jgi:hypothetical protein